MSTTTYVFMEKKVKYFPDAPPYLELYCRDRCTVAAHRFYIYTHF